jgi:hypothetical protein
MAAECVRHHIPQVKCRRPLVAQPGLQIIDCCPRQVLYCRMPAAWSRLAATWSVRCWPPVFRESTAEAPTQKRQGWLPFDRALPCPVH